MPTAVRFNPPGDVPGPPVKFESDDMGDVKAGYGFESDHTYEGDWFFFHTDHLGSTSYLTDTAGNVSQFVCYTPYGEAIVDEHLTSYENPFKFSGKELDDITGLYDHGARSRNPISTLWYGVDKLFEKYPEMGPYVYCAGNPIKLVDLDGNAPWDNKNVRDAKEFADQNKGSVSYKTNKDGYEDAIVTYPVKGSDGNSHNEQKVFSGTKQNDHWVGWNMMESLDETWFGQLCSEGSSDPCNQGDERLPDFYTATISIGDYFSGSITLDKNGNLYFSGDLGKSKSSSNSKSSPKIGGSLTANWINQASKPTEKQISEFVEGASFSVTGGAVVGGSFTVAPFANGTKTARGFGIMTPQIGGGAGYTKKF